MVMIPWAFAGAGWLAAGVLAWQWRRERFRAADAAALAGSRLARWQDESRRRVEAEAAAREAVDELNDAMESLRRVRPEAARALELLWSGAPAEGGAA